jgi:uncharacterized protein YecE (DUF72 family)
MPTWIIVLLILWCTGFIQIFIYRQKLQEVAKAILKHQPQNAFEYFNNTASAAALSNAALLKRCLERRLKYMMIK